MLPQVSTFPRFWSKVDIGASDECWLWAAYTDRDGYGVFSIQHQPKRAHRVSYELIVGKIPDGLTLDHLCRVTRCVNPYHLEPVTHKENSLRGISPWAINARKTHCPQGHPYNRANTRIYAGERHCRKCACSHSKRYINRKKQKDRDSEWIRLRK